MTPTDLEKAEDLAADLERNGRPNDAALVRGLVADLAAARAEAEGNARLVELARAWLMTADAWQYTYGKDKNDDRRQRYFAAKEEVRAALRISERETADEVAAGKGSGNA